MKTWEYKYLESSDDLMEMLQDDLPEDFAQQLLDEVGIVDAEQQQAALDDFNAGNQSHDSYRTVSSALHEMADKGAPPAVRAAAVLIDSILHASVGNGVNRPRDDVWKMLNLGEDKEPKKMRDQVLAVLVERYTDPGAKKVWTVDALAYDSDSPLVKIGVSAGAIKRVRKLVPEPPEIHFTRGRPVKTDDDGNVIDTFEQEEDRLLDLLQYWDRKVK